MKVIKTYYIDGEQVTREQAEKVIESNKRAMQSDNILDWIEVKAGVIIEHKVDVVFGEENEK